MILKIAKILGSNKQNILLAFVAGALILIIGVEIYTTYYMADTGVTYLKNIISFSQDMNMKIGNLNHLSMSFNFNNYSQLANSGLNYSKGYEIFNNTVNEVFSFQYVMISLSC